LVEIAQKVSNNKRKGVGIALNSGSAQWAFTGFTLQNSTDGKNLMSDDGKQVFFNTPENVEALQFWIDLQKKYKVMAEGIVQWTDLPAQFLAGEVAMIYHTTGNLSNIAKNAKFILMFSGILFLALAGLLIYSSFSKNKNLLKYSIFANIAFLVIFYIVLYVKLPGGEASKYISVSYFKILLYIISIGLAYLTLNAFNKKEEKETVGETVKPLGTVLEKEEDKGE